MTKRIYLIIGTSVMLCGLLLAAALAPINELTDRRGLKIREPSGRPTAMIWVPGGTFQMGTKDYLVPGSPNPERIKSDELPAHAVDLDGFWMDITPVTNREFARFVRQTGYKTFAERQLTKQDFADRGVDVSQFKQSVINAGSMCFNPEYDRTQLVTGIPGWEHQVWKVVDGADWKHPDGPDSSIDDRLDHPVVHIAWDDAVAYCEWAGKRLPTEAEFEYASRNAGREVNYPWGDEFRPQGKFMANFWQGDFPNENRNEDGFAVTSPVKTFPANALGLFDMAGNVWEWCSDYYSADYYAHSPRRNPQGPLASYDPLLPGITSRVQRGGSFLCNVNNCTGYRTRARGRGDAASSSYHNGFRCAVDSTMLKNYSERQAAILSQETPPSVSEITGHATR